MIKKFNLKLIVFLMACLYSTVLTAQINTPSGAVVPFNSNPNYNGNGIMPDAATLPTSGTYGKSQDAADAYNEWKANYIEGCSNGMFRVKFDEPNRTVSEGIAYGMQLAAYAADKALFDGLYKYWKNFQTPNTSGKTGKLMNWRIEGCTTTSSGGTGSAADADVDAAWALLIAETQWPTATSPYDYLAEAKAMLQSARELELLNDQLINGDGWGTANQCRNPSYQSPAYYRVFKDIDNNTWNGAIGGAYGLINANLTKSGSTTGLVSDWSDPSGNRNTCNPGGLGQAATDGYGYDACRNPWRMAQEVLWFNEAQAKTICTNLATYINGKGAANVGGPVYQNGNNYAGFSHNATFVSTYAMAVMGSTNQTLMNAMYKETVKTKDVIKNSTLSGYFGNTLRCVSLFMMTGNFWKYGTTSFQEINVRKATTTTNVLSGTEYDFQTHQVGVAGKLGTLTIENLGFAPLSLTGTTSKVVISGPNASDFILTQPSASTLALGQTTDFTVTFKPLAVGDKTATLTIANNDGDENPYIITLIGTGTLNATAPKMSVFDAETGTAIANNGTVAMGTSSTGSIDVRRIGIVNTGDAKLNLTTLTAAGAGYALVAIPVAPPEVNINDTGYVYVQVTSAAAGTPTGSLTIVSNDNANPSFKINFTSNFVACAAAVTANEVYQDFDGNFKNTVIGYTVAGFTENFDNPYITNKNPSTKVAKLERSIANYQGPRYVFCGTGAVNLTASKYMVSMLVYSPKVGVKIQMNLKTAADVANTVDYPSTSTATVTTTKANQWERVYFNQIAGVGKSGLTNIEIYIDPTSPGAGTYYIDDIRLDVAPCISDLSGILQDFDAHNNTTLGYDVSFLKAPVVNPVSGGINTTPNVGEYTKTKTAGTYDDGFRYNACGNKLDLSTKKYISMLVYSPVANLPIQISAKIPDGPDSNTDPDDAASSTQNTVFANTWHRLYFDLSAVSSTNLPNVFGIDIFFDPTDVSAITSGAKIYFDDVRLESTLPCVAGITATSILNDFENNRYLGVAFPGTSSGAAPYYNTIKTNTVSGGINTSTVISEFLRGTGATGTSVRFTTCQGKLDLSAGNNIIEMKVYSPNAGVPVTMSLKNASGTGIQDVTDTVKTANTWTTLRFDFTKSLNSTSVAFIDVIPDPNAKFSAAGSTNAARTYYFDDIKYAAPSPEINIQALATTISDVPTRGAFNMGTASIGDSTVTNFNIQNNGLQTLTLTGTGIASLVIGGANPDDFIVSAPTTFTTSINPLGVTGFTISFKPTAGGARSASITIGSNDSDENPYIIYLNGTATVPVVSVLNGGLTTSPVVANNNPTAINIGTSAVGVAAAPYTFSIKNTGVGPLIVKSITSSNPAFVVSALSSTTPILTGAIVTFTVTGKPAVAGVSPIANFVVVTNDPVTPSYKVNITVTGSVPKITVQDKALLEVATNNTPAISMGSGQVGVNVTPTYTFTITNAGTAPLTIASIASSSAVFSVPTLPTPATAIAAGDKATFVVTAKPAVAGLNSGIITINSDDPTTGAFKINVSVTGTSGVIDVKDKGLVSIVNSGATIEMGSALITKAATPTYTFTIANTGTGALNIASIASSSTVFALSALTPAGPIASGTSSTFIVTATPTAVGANYGVITITSDDATNSLFTIKVTVTGTAPTLNVFDGTTKLTPTSTAINVGTSTVGVAGTPYTAFNITNTGTGPLTLTSILGSTGFDVSAITPATPATIAVGGTATFTVTPKPTSVGANAGTITIATNDPTTPSFVIKVTATGTATTPKLVVSDGTTALTSNGTAINIGTAAVGSASTPYTSISFKNTGTAPLTFTSIAATSNFTVTSAPAAPTTVAVGGTVTLTLTGTPTVDGSANTGKITITTNDAGGPFVINVAVTGTLVPTPAIRVLDGATPQTSGGTAVSVGTEFVGTAAAPYTTFSVTNVGTGPLALTSIIGDANFTVTAITPTAPNTIAVNGKVTFIVTGKPTAVGVNTGTITIKSDDPNTGTFTLNVSVTGKPLVPKLNVFNGTTALTSGSSPAIKVGTAPIGVSATPFTQFNITNTGNGPLTLTSIAGSAGFDVSAITPTTPATIAAGGTATFTVTAKPTAIGANPGTITIKTDDGTTPTFVINVTADGVAASPIVEVFDKAMAPVANNNSPEVSLGSGPAGTALAPYTFTIKNTGNVALAGLDVSTVSAGFVVGAPSVATIAIGGSVTFTVTGTPSGALRKGVISIKSSNAATYLVNVSVKEEAVPSGIVTIPGITNGTTVPQDLGTVVENTPSAPKTITINNTGTLPLVITGVTSSNPVFAIGGGPFPMTIAPGASGSFTIVGTPTTTGASTGTITIVSNDPTSPFVFPVKVTGKTAPTGGELQVIDNAPGDIIVQDDSEPILIGKNQAGLPVAPYKFTLKNTGVAPLTIKSISGINGFAASPLTSYTIGIGESASFTVTGTPSTAGDVVGALLIIGEGIETFTLNVKVSVGTPTGVATALNAGAIDVYPNPTTGTSYLEFNNNFDNVNVVVYSADGNVVMTQKLGSAGVAQSTKLDKIDELAAGVYMVEVTTTQGKLVKRLIKQ